MSPPASGLEADDPSFNVYVYQVRERWPVLGTEDAEMLLMKGIIKPMRMAGARYHFRVTSWTALRAALAVVRLRAA